MKQALFCVLLLITNMISGGCFHASPSTAQPTTVPVAMITSGPMAKIDGGEPGGLWITNQKQLDDITRWISNNTRISNTSDVLHDINFDNEGVLFIWMGRQTTGGYALQMVGDRAEIKNDSVFVSVRWIEPTKGAIVTQVITNPYLILRLGMGEYDTITVVDPSGSEKLMVQAR